MTEDLNSVNPELQEDNSLRFCKGFCDKTEKGKERRKKKKKAQQEDQLKILSQQKLSFSDPYE